MRTTRTRYGMLPADVSVAITGRFINRVKRPQMKVILDLCGLGYGRQPNTVAETRTAFMAMVEENPEEAQKWYNVVCLGKLPELTTQEEQSMEAAGIDKEKLNDVLKKSCATAVSETLNPEINDAIRERATHVTKTMEVDMRKLAVEALNKAAESYRPVVVKHGSKRKTVKGTLPKEFERMVQLGSMRKNIYLAGPAGCGKTYVAGKLAEALDLPFASISCSAGMSETQVSGWLLPIGKGGQFQFVSADFVRMYETGGVYLFDEIDAADPNMLTFLNQAIANEGFYIPQRHENSYVKKHDNFVCIAAANTYGLGGDAMYTGRNALDAATLDRFRIGFIRMDYDDNVEAAIVDPDVLAWGRAIRDAVRRLGLQKIMSTRVMLDATDMKAEYDWTLEQLNESYFADWSRDEMARVGYNPDTRTMRREGDQS